MLKDIKKGDTVAIVGFTGIRLTDAEVVGATKTQIKTLKKDGSEMVFDRKTGIQKNVEEGKEKYANKAMTLENAPVNKPRTAKAPKKKGKKVVEKEDVGAEEFDEEFEDEEFEEVKKAPAKKKAAKKPVEVEEDDFDEEDDFEDDDEDDFEEI